MPVSLSAVVDVAVPELHDARSVKLRPRMADKSLEKCLVVIWFEGLRV